MRLERKPQTGGRVLSGISHGGHVVADDSEQAVEKTAGREDLTTLEAVSADEVRALTTPFAYLLTELADQFPAKHLPNDNPAAVVAALKALGGAMVEDPPPANDPLQPRDNSTIPPVYTYWGQFIDHDLTANTDSDFEFADITKADLTPVEPSIVAEKLRNLRSPALNLDSVYGDGPTFEGEAPTEAADFYDGIELKVGTAAAVPNDPEEEIDGVRIPPEDDLDRDLPRVDKKARIGDARNDENLIIAQFHVAFLRFHNAVVKWVKENEPDTYGGDPGVFNRARQLTRWHYQWLVVHDYLKTVTLAGVADKILLGGNKHYAPRDGVVYMPLEFSVAGYRFGHSMVRAVYDYNRNFGRPGNNVAPNASFFLLFAFTGNFSRPAPFFGATDVLPFNWIIEWDRMIHKGDRFPDHFARKIETRLAPPLRDLTNRGNEQGLPPDAVQILKRLATSNLLRGYLLAMPTGQAVAEAMGVTPLTSRELQQDNNSVMNDILRDAGFLEATPLWFYLLKEAEIHASGNSLGELGSRIVCETLIGQLRADPDSYLSYQGGGWTPAQGVKLPNGDPIVGIADFLRFAGVLP